MIFSFLMKWKKKLKAKVWKKKETNGERENVFALFSNNLEQKFYIFQFKNQYCLAFCSLNRYFQYFFLCLFANLSDTRNFEMQRNHFALNTLRLKFHYHGWHISISVFGRKKNEIGYLLRRWFVGTCFFRQ